MSTADGRDTGSAVPVVARRRPFPFWVLQLAELIAAVVLVDVSVHVRGGGSLVATAIALAGLAAFARGPLGLVRVCPQRLHVALAVTVAALAAASPLVAALRPDIEGIIVLEFAAVGVIRVATLTRTSDQPSPGRRPSTPGGTVVDVTATVVTSPTEDTAHSGSTPAEDPSTVRRAGRAAGAAAESGRRLVESHGPAAEAQVKRSVRWAGRWAGRFATWASEDRSPGRPSSGA